MSFFEELPDPPKPRREPQPPWMGPPRGELPIPLPLALLVGRAEGAAVLLGPLRVYSTGVELDVVATVRDPRDAFYSPIHYHPHVRKEDVIRLALICSDGSSAELERPHGREEGGRVLAGRGGGGGDGSWEHRLWFWPLPTPGLIEVVCWWPTFGVPETRTSFDAGPILDAASRVERLWPDDGSSSSGGASISTQIFSSGD